MKQALKYLTCIAVTLILSVGFSLVYSSPKHYGVEKVLVTRVSLQDGQREKTVTKPEDIAKIVNEIRGLEIQHIGSPDTMDTIANTLVGVPGYRFKFYMTDGTTYSCSHVPGNDGRGSFSDSDGHKMTVQMASAKLWRIMDYEEVLINSEGKGTSPLS